MSTVVCHLFVVRVLERSAVCSQALCVVSGEASANFERPSQGHFSLDSRLANDKAFATVFFVFKIRHTLTSNEARKVGLVTVASLGGVSGEVPANFERPSPSHFSLDSRQQAIVV